MDRRYFFLVLPLLAGACGRDAEPVLARVDGRPITAMDLDRELQNIPSGGGAYLSTPTGQKEILKVLVRNRVVVAEAAKSAVADRPETRKKLAELDAEFMRQREKERERLLVGEFIRDLREGTLKVSDEDMKAAWSSEKAVKASHILVSDEGRAQALKERLDKGESFDKLAKEFSEDNDTRERGGDLGYLMPGSLMDQDFENTLFALDIGKSAGPIASPYGFHLIKKTGERPLSEQPFPQAEKSVRAMLEKRRFQSWLVEAQKRHAVDINDAALSDAAVPPIPNPK